MPLPCLLHSLTELRQVASRCLREAASLAPDNSQVKAVFDKIQSDDLQHRLESLCCQYVSEHDENAGKEALSYLNRLAEVPGNVATTCLDLMLGPGILDDGAIQDGIVAGLLRGSKDAKFTLARLLNEEITVAIFGKLFQLGDGSSDGMTDVILEAAVWLIEKEQEECKKDVFQLYLARLIGVGDEVNGRALKGLARLLVADTELLHKFIDEDTFDAILSTLDYRNSAQVRSQATLVTAKYLQASGEHGQMTLAHFFTSRLMGQKNEDLVLAFSAAAGVFPVAPSSAAHLFLTESFVQTLVPLLVKKAKSEKVELAALQMLDSACLDGACREAIKKHCASWLKGILATGKDQRSALAAVILCKTHASSSPETSTKAESATEELDVVKDLLPKFKSMMFENSAEVNRSSIEALAYASVRSKVKDDLAKDYMFLRKFLLKLKQNPSWTPTSFGGLALIENLTRYSPNLSEEQKRIAQLKAFANSSKTASQLDPLEDDAAVTERCKAVVNAGAIPVFVGMSKDLSPNSMQTIIKILLSLSQTRSLRGTIAQQGGIRLMLKGYTSIQGSSNLDIEARHAAAHALACTLISIDPSLFFSSTNSLQLPSVIRPILSLLSEDSGSATQGSRDLLPTFEALLALTNLTSFTTNGAAEVIIRDAYPTVEDLLLNSLTGIQRAATQLVCNLVNCPLAVETYADESPAAARRMHILLAIADVTDVETRSAAAGALAVLTEFEGAVNTILARERGMEIILGLVEDESGDKGIIHRACHCVRNIVCQEADTGKRARRKVKELGGEKTLIDVLMGNMNDVGIVNCIRQAMQALKA